MSQSGRTKLSTDNTPSIVDSEGGALAWPFGFIGLMMMIVIAAILLMMNSSSTQTALEVEGAQKQQSDTQEQQSNRHQEPADTYREQSAASMRATKPAIKTP